MTWLNWMTNLLSPALFHVIFGSGFPSPKHFNSIVSPIFARFWFKLTVNFGGT